MGDLFNPISLWVWVTNSSCPVMFTCSAKLWGFVVMSFHCFAHCFPRLPNIPFDAFNQNVLEDTVPFAWSKWVLRPLSVWPDRLVRFGNGAHASCCRQRGRCPDISLIWSSNAEDLKSYLGSPLAVYILVPYYCNSKKTLNIQKITITNNNDILKEGLWTDFLLFPFTVYFILHLLLFISWKK